MTAIFIYDTDAETLEKIETEKDTTAADIIESLLYAIEKGFIDINDYV